MRKLEDFIVYHGTLDALNKLMTFQGSSHYKVTCELSTYAVGHGNEYDEAIKLAKNLIRDKGYDGIVNARTSLSARDNSFPKFHVLLEGTPIKLLHSKD